MKEYEKSAYALGRLNGVLTLTVALYESGQKLSVDTKKVLEDARLAAMAEYEEAVDKLADARSKA